MPGTLPANLHVLLAAACAGTPNALLISDRSGVVVWCNEAAGALTGYPCEELIGRNLSVFRSGAHRPHLYQEIWETVLAGRAWRGKLLNRHADGSLRCEELTAFPVGEDEPGGPNHFVSVRRDIGDELKQKRTQESLRRQLTVAIGRVQDTLSGGVEVLANLADHHSSTFGKHAHRVASLAVSMARHLELSSEDVRTVRDGALLHDIGKTVEAYYHGKQCPEGPQRYLHASLGAQLLSPIPGVDAVAAIVRHHHEHIDGSGFPDRLSGGHIPVGARLVAAANAYDRLNSLRPAPVEQILEALRRTVGIRLDPVAFEALRVVIETDALSEEGFLVSLRDLKVGMTLTGPVRTVSGRLLCSGRTQVTETILGRLCRVHVNDPVIDRIRIEQPNDESPGQRPEAS
ncbi:MAG: HD domain-containing protein [Rhodothermales bacterium]|nr:HD domain-containing protein [Rhodothermales bacterium]MBO6778456.1 HD domain-containing protein [Rhodothermales bacterium]